MATKDGGNHKLRDKERGATLYIVAASIVVMLGISALAIDLVSFYAARAEAQRTADASALAGAKAFVDAGCTSAAGGCVSGGAQETLAKQQAKDVASQNTVAGQAVTLQDSDISFNYSPPLAGPEEPQITVTVQRTTARANALPTFFGRVFGIQTVNLSAAATAEAYNPSGGTTPVGTTCLKPFLVPNCDPVHTSPANSAPNTSCPGQGVFFAANGNIQHGGLYPSGVIGQPLQLHSQAAPSQWYEIAVDGGQSKANFRANVETCSASQSLCGQVLQTLDGKAVGPTDQSINALIHADADGLNQGQDSIDTRVGPPFIISGGKNNPNAGLRLKQFYSPSDSVVSVPVYDGHNLHPGKDTVTVIGYMQLFIKDVNHNGSDDLIDAVILNIGGCGTSAGNPPPVTSTEGSPIPIRLIRTN